MHEKMTIGGQLENRIRRGGSLNWSALPDPAAEFVVFRRPDGTQNPLYYEILEAERTKGIADCLGRWQGKWGTQVRVQTDASPLHATERGVKELFGWKVGANRLHLAGHVGPWIHRATARLKGADFILTALEEQGEETAFQAHLFTLDASGLTLDPSASYSKATKDARWVPLRQLVAERGEDASYLYWSTIALALQQWRKRVTLKNLITHFYPGEYRF